MTPYSPKSTKARTVSVDDVHPRTADQGRKAATAKAKALRHAAQQEARKQTFRTQTEN